MSTALPYRSRYNEPASSRNPLEALEQLRKSDTRLNDDLTPFAEPALKWRAFLRSCGRKYWFFCKPLSAPSHYSCSPNILSGSLPHVVLEKQVSSSVAVHVDLSKPGRRLSSNEDTPAVGDSMSHANRREGSSDRSKISALWVPLNRWRSTHLNCGPCTCATEDPACSV